MIFSGPFSYTDTINSEYFQNGDGLSYLYTYAFDSVYDFEPKVGLGLFFMSGDYYKAGRVISYDSIGRTIYAGVEYPFTDNGRHNLHVGILIQSSGEFDIEGNNISLFATQSLLGYQYHF